MIYSMVGAEDHEFIVCDSAGYDQLDRLKGTSLADTWQPFEVELVTVDEGRPQRWSDFPSLINNSKLVLRTRALVALRDMLEEGGEILPVVTDGGVPLYVLHVTRIIDAMDRERSIYKAIGGDETLLLDKSVAFHEPMIRGVPFFRLAYRNSPIFVNESFIQRVREAELVGLDFFLAWSPEGDPMHQNW